MQRIVTVFILLLVGCRESDLGLKVPFEGEKLVLWGNLSANNNIQISVTRTFDPVGVLPKNIGVANAEVVVYKNGQAYTILKPTGKPGDYVSDSLIRTGAKYVVKVDCKGFPSVESEAVEIPDEIVNLEYTRVRDVKGYVNPDQPQDLITLAIEKAKNVGVTYYSIGFASFFKTDTLLSDWPVQNNVLAAEEADCYINGRGLIIEGARFFSKLFTSDCLPAGKTDIAFYVEIQSNRGVFIGDSVLFEKAEKVALGLAVVDKWFYEYCKNERKQPEGLGRLVFAPQNTISNIKNGYGLIFGTNAKMIELK